MTMADALKNLKFMLPFPASSPSNPGDYVEKKGGPCAAVPLNTACFS